MTLVTLLRPLAAIVLTTVLAGPMAAAGDRFVTGFADLPLMPGLSEVPDADMAFDTVGGRIVIALVKGPVAVDAVTAFYADTLAQLGWRRQADRSFLREGERLSLDFVPDGAGLFVRFTLAPE